MSREGKPPAFVVFGDDWGRHVSTMQHLFAHIIPQSPVIWLNAIGHREPTLRDLPRAWEKARAMLRKELRDVSQVDAEPDAVSSPRAVIQPRVLPWHSNRVVAALNRTSLRGAIRRAVRQAGIRDFVLVTGSPPSSGVVGTCGERASIYFCMDDFLVLPGTSPHMLAPLERELLRRVDAVVATSRRLVEVKRCTAGRGYQLPQGVNYEHFAAPRPRPEELQRLPPPIVGFAGGVGTAVDAPTIHAIAAAIPQGSVVLLGPVSSDHRDLAAPNVHVLGPRPYADLPAFVQAFDVGIIPYVDNDWTRAVDPLKLLEYLAAGIPVVASPLPEVWKYAAAVRIAPLGAAFASAVVETLHGHGGPAGEQARDVARGHTWQRRARRFIEIVDEVRAEVMS